MKRVLLDYDNTICNLSKGMFEKWNDLSEFNQYCKVELSDIVEYKLHHCLNRLGIDINKAIDLLNNFWNIENIYQEYYYDMDCKNSIIKLLKKLRSEGYKVELNTLCPSKEFMQSKIKRISTDINLLEVIDDLHISLFNGNPDTCKNFDYDIIIEDNPIYIEKYLKNNDLGIVYMPLWKYNKYLKGCDRIKILEMEK